LRWLVDARPAEPHGIDVVTELLDRSGLRYEVVEHEAT
jgi:hypothetical protein